MTRVHYMEELESVRQNLIDMGRPPRRLSLRRFMRFQEPIPPSEPANWKRKPIIRCARFMTSASV